MSLATINPFCEWSDVQNRLSAAGANLRVDDDPAARDEVLIDATVEVMQYTFLLYSEAALANSNWVNRKTRDVACWYAASRRANPVPKSIQALYEKAIKDLENVQVGAFLIPDAPMRKNAAPVLSNQRVAMYPFPRVVTATGKSTGTQEGYTPFNDRFDYVFDYSI